MVCDVGVSVNLDGRDFEVLVHSSVIQCFNVLQFVNEVVAWRRESTGGHGVKHESIIGVWTVPDSHNLIS